MFKLKIIQINEYNSTRMYNAEWTFRENRMISKYSINLISSSICQYSMLYIKMIVNHIITIAYGVFQNDFGNIFDLKRTKTVEYLIGNE